MYGITENTQETTVKSNINAGIQENISLGSVEFSPLSEGNDPIIQINFVDAFGSELRELLWEVDNDMVISRNEERERTHSRSNKELGFVKGEVVTNDDALKQAYQLFNQRAKHIATKFISEKDLIEALAGASSYQEFGKAYVGALNKAASDVKVRLKVILNSKDFSTLPTFPPFIESMEIPVESTQLSINPKYDRIEKRTVDNNASDPMAMAGSAGLPDTALF